MKGKPAKRLPWQDIYDAFTIGPSRLVGQGLFAGTPIKARAKIGEFEGEKIGLREARRRASGRRIVAIVELERHAIDATHTGRGFRYINHSCDGNTYFRCTAIRAEIYAKRDIRKGEELTVDYGETQHNGTLKCRCGSAKCRGFI